MFILIYVVMGYIIAFTFLRSDISRAGKLHGNKRLRYLLALSQALIWPIIMVMGIIVVLHSLISRFLKIVIYHLVLEDKHKNQVL